METKIIHVGDIEKDKQAITAAAQMLIAGELVAMPTETVYGLAANGMDELAVKKLYEAKQRPGYKAFSLQVPDVSMVNDIAQQVPDMAWQLFEKFCPGPITIVLPKKNTVPRVVTGGKKTVGIRIPANDIALAVLKAAGVPLAVPSANISAHPSPTSAQMVYDDMQGLIPLILDGGPCNLGIESTIVDCTGDEPVIIRQGAISEKKILDCINNKD
ncbi:L-threonylcarbamoyladenylate synthase [uncultured Anaerovibrio sp.]|uniref:L-threonylcarbamoyladenylate synthase n=1 Tax=uncultured Anaerovibrio sp. TaxID=361586 RepID=UPI0026057C77|nr:L-threonylcarbamoyladenylate synthase [uncultured Anaerovibrio sp.]